MSKSAETVLITGAAGALGRATVDAFLARGARLALLDRSEALLRDALPAAALDSRHRLLGGDVTDGEAMRKLLAPIGPISALVHIAGGFSMGEDTHALSRASWDGMMNLNAWSFVAVTSAVVPAMLAAGGGAIVAVTARAAGCGSAHMAAYCASKSALQRLVESLSAEVRDRGISVNSVAPSIIDTPANRKAMPNADFARWVPPATLAETIVFLASAGARSMHGQHLVVEALS